MIPAGNNTKPISPVNHTTKTIQFSKAFCIEFLQNHNENQSALKNFFLSSTVWLLSGIASLEIFWSGNLNFHRIVNLAVNDGFFQGSLHTGGHFSQCRFRSLIRTLQSIYIERFYKNNYRLNYFRKHNIIDGCQSCTYASDFQRFLHSKWHTCKVKTFAKITTCLVHKAVSKLSNIFQWSKIKKVTKRCSKSLGKTLLLLIGIKLK